MATKQVIVVNKDLNMSKGKMAAQVSHASMAFLTSPIFRGRKEMFTHPVFDQDSGEQSGYVYDMFLDNDTYEWMSDCFTKVILEAHNEKEMEKIVKKAVENGLIEDKDFFKIIDKGLTEFNNVPTWTCIGFKPMQSEKIDKVTKRLQLFKDSSVSKDIKEGA